MNKCDIFFSTTDELIELDIQDKGWRGDVIVKIGNEIFKPVIITPTRLLQEFNDSISKNQVYDIEPNLILVSRTERTQIINSLVEMVKNGYFSKIKAIDLMQEYSLYSQELQKIENWIKVY